MYDLGHSLRSLRENAKMTQAQLAVALGISRSSINNYENNIRRPSYETLEIYADYFHTDMNALLCGSPPTETIVEPAIIFAGGLLGIVLPRPVDS